MGRGEGPIVAKWAQLFNSDKKSAAKYSTYCTVQQCLWAGWSGGCIGSTGQEERGRGDMQCERLGRRLLVRRVGVLQCEKPGCCWFFRKMAGGYSV